jgi:hypothetical protein
MRDNGGDREKVIHIWMWSSFPNRDTACIIITHHPREMKSMIRFERNNNNNKKQKKDELDELGEYIPQISVKG